MKKVLALALCLALLPVVGCAHIHVPGPEATCTTDQVCTKCDEVLVPAFGHTTPDSHPCDEDLVCTVCGEVLAPATEHTPGEYSCPQGQVCTVCGEVLKKPKGHNVDTETGICEDCGLQVCDPGCEYINGGIHGENSYDADSVIPETEQEGHYHNNIDAYYSETVLICGDYGMEYFRPDEDGSDTYAEILSDFAARFPNINVISMIVPKCAAYYAPSGYTDPHNEVASFITNTYKKMSNDVITVDTMKVMDQHLGEYMFYRTDHHWTSLGAYYASVAFCDAMGIDARPLEDYGTIYRTGFVGTLEYYSGGVSALRHNPDYTACHFPKAGYTFRYTWDMYNWYDGLAIDPDNESYAGVFMEGDVPFTVIKTDNKNGKTLMVFKDSYGNAFVPYMIDYYEQIIVVDMREETGSTADLIDRYNVTDAVIVNNAQGATSLMNYLSWKLES